MMGKGAYYDGLPEALDRGLVDMATIDEAVRRVLLLKLRLGLFDDPYRRCGSPEAIAAIKAQPARRALARETARKSIVLLTHAEGTLPLKKSLKAIAIVGPFGQIVGGNSEPDSAPSAKSWVETRNRMPSCASPSWSTNSRRPFPTPRYRRQREAPSNSRAREVSKQRCEMRGRAM